MAMLCVFRMSMSVSMKEVAVAAGVSKATVSKVLSGKRSALRISPATQSHVRSVANQLGYVLGPIIRYRPAEIDDRSETADDRLQTIARRRHRWKPNSRPKTRNR